MSSQTILHTKAKHHIQTMNLALKLWWQASLFITKWITFSFPCTLAFCLCDSVLAQIAHAYLFADSSIEHVESSTILSFRKLLWGHADSEQELFAPCCRDYVANKSYHTYLSWGRTWERKADKRGKLAHPHTLTPSHLMVVATQAGRTRFSPRLWDTIWVALGTICRECCHSGSSAVHTKRYTTRNAASLVKT